MRNANIKEEVTELCNDMIVFWERLLEEVERIPDQNQEAVVLKWKRYFPEHSDAVSKLSFAKMHIDKLERDLIERGVLRYED